MATVCRVWQTGDLAKCVKWLDVGDAPQITMDDTFINRFVNLQSIKAHSTNVTSAGLRKLVNLRHLDLSGHEKIYDTGIIWMTNLSSLVLFRSRVTDMGLSRLTNLTSLSLDRSYSYVTDKGLLPLTNLTHLTLQNRYENEPMSNILTSRGMPYLKSLSLVNDTIVLHSDIMFLAPVLETLNLRGNRRLTDRSIKELTNLTSLCLCDDYCVTDNALIGLTNLRSLAMYGHSRIDGRIFKHRKYERLVISEDNTTCYSLFT